MTAYVILDIDVHDQEGYQKYRADVPALIAKHVGEYLVRGGDFEVLAGDWHPHRSVLFRFPNGQAHRNFLADPAYAELKALRLKTTKTLAAVDVDGVE